jgi:hypothetical protein
MNLKNEINFLISLQNAKINKKVALKIKKGLLRWLLIKV